MISIMFNPFFDAKKRTLEVFLRKPIERDLYDEVIRVEILGFLRTGMNFQNFPSLLQAIYNDVFVSSELLY